MISFVKTLIPLMKNGRISLISMEQSPESYVRIRRRADRMERGSAYTEFTAVQFRDTLPTLGLSRLSNVFEKGSNPIRVLQII